MPTAFSRFRHNPKTRTLVAQRERRNTAIDRYEVLAELKRTEGPNGYYKEILFVVAAPGACEWAKFQQSIGGARWECGEKDFAYSLDSADPSYTTVLNDARQEGYIIRVVQADYIPHGVQTAVRRRRFVRPARKKA